MLPDDYFSAPSTDGELLPVVDWDDREVGVAARAEIHAKGLLHRAVHVIATDGAVRLLLQKRSMLKDSFPGWWDISVGGHVGTGESYAEAAVREIGEELGIAGAKPVLVSVLPPADESGWEHTHVFACTIVPETVRFDEKEIEAVRWVSVADYTRLASPGAADPDWRIAPSGHRSIQAWLRIRT